MPSLRRRRRNPPGAPDLAPLTKRHETASFLRQQSLVQGLLNLVLLAPSHLRQRAGPEDFPQHRAVLKQALALGRESVQAGGDQGLYRVR